MNNFELLFGLKRRVTRREYIFWGVTLMVIKYLGEAALYYAACKEFLSPLNFFSPVLNARYPSHKQMSDFFLPAVILWTIPFVWIGVGMSIRRALMRICHPGSEFYFLFQALITS